MSEEGALADVVGTALKRLALNIGGGLVFLGLIYLFVVLLPDGKEAGDAMLLLCLPVLIGNSLGGAVRIGWESYRERQRANKGGQAGERGE